MRLYELIDRTYQERLDEFNAKKAIAAGSLAVAALNPADRTDDQPMPVNPAIEEMKRLADAITSKYKVNAELASKVVQLAQKHGNEVFPATEDILAIIGIESSFNPNAVSGLKKDPAIGLTQIRPGVWKLNPEKLKVSIEKQIETSAEILSLYNKRLKNPEAAVHAYNVGITNFRKGILNPNYVQKFNREKNFFDSISNTEF